MPKLLTVGVFLGVLAVSASGLLANQIAIADAGPDQEPYVGQTVGLDGSGSYDPDGDPILEWLWNIDSQPAGSSPYLSDTDTPDPAFRADITGDYILSLMVSDGMDWSDPDTMTISASEILPPVAVADADVTYGIVPLTVHFDGSQSYDPQGGELTYRWTFGDGSDFVEEMSPTHVYVEAGTYLASLRVYDTLGQFGADSILITVEVPEPSALLLLAAGGLAMLRRKGR